MCQKHVGKDLNYTADTDMGTSDSSPCADVPARGTDIEEILNGMLGPPTWFRLIIIISSS